MEKQRIWRWMLRDPNGVWRRYPTIQAALDASDGDDALYYEDDDGELWLSRRGVRSKTTQLR